jgi:arylsulfatase A-like enzyme
MRRIRIVKVKSLLLCLLVWGPWTFSALADNPARPNILFCIADDASFPHMGAYGCSWVQTPAFDRVARDGILFRNAYTPNAKCAPSRSCIITGRNSWQLEEAVNHIPNFPARFKTYPEALQESGYHVGFTGKGWAPGNPGKVKGKTRQLVGPAYQKRSLVPPTKAISACDYAANFADFLADCSVGQPFCFWYGAKEPHRRYEYGSGVNKGGKRLDQVDRVPGCWPDTEIIRNDLLDYALEIEHVDRHLQRMLAELERRDLLENTLVMVTADNGMPFPRIKGQAYEWSNHLPLAVMWQRGIARPGRVIEDFVNFIDFAPTFLDMARINEAESGMEPITGRSLMSLFQTAASGRVEAARDHILIGKERHDVGRPHDWGYPIRGIRKGDYLYIHNFEIDRWPCGNPETGYLNCDGGATKTEIRMTRLHPSDKRYWDLCFGKRPAEELYRIDRDTDCLHNLAADPRLQETKRALREQLFRELKEQGDLRMVGQGQVYEAYPYRDAGTANFYDRFINRGEKVKAGWVNPSDFETEPIR